MRRRPKPTPASTGRRLRAGICDHCGGKFFKGHRCPPFITGKRWSSPPAPEKATDGSQLFLIDCPRCDQSTVTRNIPTAYGRLAIACNACKFSGDVILLAWRGLDITKTLDHIEPPHPGNTFGT